MLATRLTKVRYLLPCQTFACQVSPVADHGAWLAVATRANAAPEAAPRPLRLTTGRAAHAADALVRPRHIAEHRQDICRQVSR